MYKLIKKILLKIKIERNYLVNKFSKLKVVDDKINKSYIKKFLPKNPVIIDAGAHIGADSVEWSRLTKGSIVHSLEPVKEIYKSLIYNTRKYKNIKTYNIALGNHCGKQEFHISSGSSDASSSLLKPKSLLNDHPDIKFTKSILVNTLTLDDWAKKNYIDNVDFLWFDLQGFELDVLKASKKILPTIKAIHMEISMKPTYEGVALYPEVKAWMESQNFNVEIEAIPKGWDMGNVLFIRNIKS